MSSVSSTPPPEEVSRHVIEAGEFGTVTVYKLDDGQKVIDQADVQRFVAYLRKGGDMGHPIVSVLQKEIDAL